MSFTRLTDILGEVRYLKQFKEKFIDIESRNGEKFQIWLKCNYSLYSYSIYSTIGNSQKEVDYSLKTYKKIKDLIDDLRLSLLKLGFLDSKNEKKEELTKTITSFSEEEFPTFCDITETDINITSINSLSKEETDIIYNSMTQNRNNFININRIDRDGRIISFTDLSSKKDEDFIIKGRTKIGALNLGLRTALRNLEKKVKDEINEGDVTYSIYRDIDFTFNSENFINTAFLTVTNRSKEILKELIEKSSEFRKGNLKDIKHFVFFRSGNLSKSDLLELNNLGNGKNIFFQELSSLSTSEKSHINLYFSNRISSVGAERRDALNSLLPNYTKIIMFDDNISDIKYIPDYEIIIWQGKKLKKPNSKVSIFGNKSLYLKFIGEILYKNYDLFTISSPGQFYKVGTAKISKISSGFMSFKKESGINFEPFSLSEDRDFGLKYLKVGKQVIISDIYIFEKLEGSDETGVGTDVYKKEEYLDYLKSRFESTYKDYNLKASKRESKDKTRKSLSLSSDILERGIVYQK